PRSRPLCTELRRAQCRGMAVATAAEEVSGERGPPDELTAVGAERSLPAESANGTEKGEQPSFKHGLFTFRWAVADCLSRPADAQSSSATPAGPSSSR